MEAVFQDVQQMIDSQYCDLQSQNFISLNNDAEMQKVAEKHGGFSVFINYEEEGRQVPAILLFILVDLEERTSKCWGNVSSKQTDWLNSFVKRLDNESLKAYLMHEVIIAESQNDFDKQLLELENFPEYLEYLGVDANAARSGHDLEQFVESVEDLIDNLENAETIEQKAQIVESLGVKKSSSWLYVCKAYLSTLYYRVFYGRS